MLADDKMKNCLVWDIACLVNPIKPGTFWTLYHLGGRGVRSAPKLSPKLLEGVTCFKKGPKIKFSQYMTQFDPV